MRGRLDLGHSLRVPLQALEDWAKANMSDIVAAREGYDGSAAEFSPAR